MLTVPRDSGAEDRSNDAVLAQNQVSRGPVHRSTGKVGELPTDTESEDTQVSLAGGTGTGCVSPAETLSLSIKGRICI